MQAECMTIVYYFVCMAIPGNELPWEEPKIPESILIRMGMIIQLKEVISSTYLLKQQRQLSLMMAQRLESLENLICLGPKPANLSVLAFVVKHPLSGLYLHHKFVSTLLNDLFGLQTCVSSAHDSPFVKYSLGIQHIDGRDDHKNNGSKEDVFVPGVSVMDLPWFFTEEQVRQTKTKFLLKRKDKEFSLFSFFQ